MMDWAAIKKKKRQQELANDPEYQKKKAESLDSMNEIKKFQNDAKDMRDKILWSN